MSNATIQARRNTAPVKGLAKKATSKVPAKALVRTKTLRLEPLFEEGLGMLKEVLHKPINKMVNEAVGEYIERRTAQVEHELTTTIEQLRAYRKRDPAFANARKAFVEAEAIHGKTDPMEGRIVNVRPPPGAYARRGTGSKVTTDSNPALAMVRERLRG